MGALTLASLAGKTTQEKLELAGAYAGTTGSVMNGIWHTESGGGKHMLSPAGAAGHFGLMPKSVTTWSERLGVKIDPNDFDQSLLASASALKENLTHFGNLPDALKAYNAGWDRSRWGNSETRAYVDKVIGSGHTAGEPVPYKDIVDIHSLSTEDILSIRPEDIKKGALERPAKDVAPRKNAFERRQAFRDVMSGGAFVGTPHAPQFSNDSPGVQEAEAIESADHAAQAEAANNGVLKKFSASLNDNTITMALFNSIDKADQLYDPGFDYMANMSGLEEGLDYSERQRMRNAISLPDAERIKTEIDETKKLRAIYGGYEGKDALVYGLAGGVADPAGFVLGAGVGKGLELAGVGSRALIASARPLAAAGSTIAEGVVGNVLGTAALDAAGTYESPEDYAMSAGFGFAIGSALAPFTLRSGMQADALQRQGTAMTKAAAQREATVLKQAQAELGGSATSEQIAVRASEIHTANRIREANVAFAPVDDVSRFLSADGTLLTADPVLKDKVVRKYGLEAASDDAEANILAEYYARAERFTELNPVDPKVKSFSVLAQAGMESTGIRMLKSEDPLMRMVGQTLVEGTTGAGGRRHTAAMTQALRERVYNAPIREIDDLFQVYRKSTGRGFWTEALGNGTARQEFDKAVAVEIHSRGKEGFKSQAPEPVRRAADIYADGYHRMAIDQQVAETVGAARIEPDVSYFPQRISGTKLTNLTNGERRVFSDIIAEQVRERYGWDQDFSKYFGTKYIERGVDRARGSYDVPVNLNSPDAGDIIEDILDGLAQGKVGPARDKIEAMRGKFSRGGASHTKKRTDLDLTKVYKDGKNSFTLLDIMDTDMMGLYRSYARRASGDVALSQFGIQGDKGLKLLRKALQVGGADGKRASVHELEAFDQIAAELLNKPFGQHMGNFMDNTRLMTSLTRLGGMGFTQLGEYGNGIAALGVHRVFSAIKDLPRLMKEVGEIKGGNASTNSLLHSLETGLGGEIGMDDYHNTRMFDVRDNEIQLYGRENVGVASKLIRAGANLQAIVSFQRPLTAVQTRGMAEQIIQKAIRFIREGKDDVALKDMGFTPELNAALKKNLRQIAEFDAKGNLKALDIHKGDLTAAQKRDIIGVVNRGAHQIIQRTYVGETGKWAHSGFLKLLFQFRTFGLTAAEKQWGRNVANHGALKSSAYLLGAMSFAVPIYLARTQAYAAGLSGSKREEFLEQRLSPQAIARATMNYASSAGLLPDILDLGGGTVSGIAGSFESTKEAGAKLADTVGARGQGQGRLLGGAVAPGAGQLEDAWKVAHGDWSQLDSIIPGANLPYVHWFFNLFEGKD